MEARFTNRNVPEVVTINGAPLYMYIQFQSVQRMGGISEENVKSYFASLDDTGEALKEASRKARAYLARKSDHATFLDVSWTPGCMRPLATIPVVQLRLQRRAMET